MCKAETASSFMKLPDTLLSVLLNFLPWVEAIQLSELGAAFHRVVRRGDWCTKLTEYSHLSHKKLCVWFRYFHRLKVLEGEFRLRELLLCVAAAQRHLESVTVRLLPAEPQDLLFLYNRKIKVDASEAVNLKRVCMRGEGSCCLLFLAYLGVCHFKLCELDFSSSSFTLPNELLRKVIQTSDVVRLNDDICITSNDVSMGSRSSLPIERASRCDTFRNCAADTEHDFFSNVAEEDEVVPLWKQYFLQLIRGSCAALNRLHICVLSTECEYFDLWQWVFRKLAYGTRAGTAQPLHLESFRFVNIISTADLPAFPIGSTVQHVVGMHFQSPDQLITAERHLQQLYGRELTLTASSLKLDIEVSPDTLGWVAHALYELQGALSKAPVEMGARTHTASAIYLPMASRHLLQRTRNTEEVLNKYAPLPLALVRLLREGFLQASSSTFVGARLSVKFRASYRHVEQPATVTGHYQNTEWLHPLDRRFFAPFTVDEWKEKIHFPNLNIIMISLDLTGAPEPRDEPIEASLAMERTRRRLYIVAFVRLLYRSALSYNLNEDSLYLS